ncbi:hypothetical protein BG000_005208 [Podila horticola]|nr:hypothetical protein BG000_005208 [Podila horticola]
MHLSIFEIPFIQDDIASYLTNKDLKQCRLVSQAWLGYFNPYLWQSMTLGRSYHHPESKKAERLAVLEKNMHYVKTLNDLHCNHTLFITSPGFFPRLQTIVCYPTIYDKLETYNRVLKLIGLHPQLRSVTLKVCEMTEPLASNLAHAIETHPGLREFRLFGQTVSLTLAQDVMFACRHLETLVWGLAFRGLPHAPHVIELAKERELMRATSETRIRRLDIRYLSTYLEEKLLIPLLHRCTNLERLRFTLNRIYHRSSELVQLKAVIQERCPGIKYLSLFDATFFRYECTPQSAILSSTTGGLEFFETNLKRSSLETVRVLLDHHSHTLKSIQLTGPAQSIPIEHFVQIANSCLHLETLRCEYELSLTSFRTNGKQLVKIRWNCHGLRRLRVRWGLPPADLPAGYYRHLLKYMGKRIGMLANLQELEIDGKDLVSQQYGRLGMENLRQLRTLVVLGTFKDVKWSAEDAEWMLEHWPRLVRIEGREGDHLAKAFEVFSLRRPWLDRATPPTYFTIPELGAMCSSPY